MKRLIRATTNQEYISCMSKLGENEKPAFMVGVYEDGSHIGEPYLKIYDNPRYSKSEYVTRLSLKDGHRIIHDNYDGRKEWNIDNKTLKALDTFLAKPSRRFIGYTNWQVLLYLWNYETSIIISAPDDLYDTDIDAFADGYYDTEDNLKNPNYMPSYAAQPSFLK